jgi:DNA-binding MarR family transcriptional regulator
VVDQPGVTPTELSSALYLTPSTVTRLVEKLETKHLVRRESEGKKTLVYPTNDGQALRLDIASAWDRVGDRCAQLVGEENVCQLTKQVLKAAQALGDA